MNLSSLVGLSMMVICQAAEIIPLVPAGVVFEYQGRSQIAIRASLNPMGRMTKLVIDGSGQRVEVPEVHMADLANPLLATIDYSEYTDEDGGKVSLIRLSYDQRIYDWGSGSNKVEYAFKNGAYTGRTLIVPKGQTTVSSKLEVYKR